MSSRVALRPRGAGAGLAALALVAALGLPLIDAVLAEEPAPFCGKDRCCCAPGSAAGDERPCLRRSCGCERPDATAPQAPLRLEAVLPATARSSPLPRGDDPGVDAEGDPLRRPHPPLFPPPRPRRLLPAFS
jgi:hypothetical protein